VRPVKTVTFDLLKKRTSTDEFTTTTQELSELEVEDPMDHFTVTTQEQVERPGCQMQSAALQNDKADERLVHAAWLRKTTDNVYMSNRKSMNLWTYVHAAHQRTETTMLLDSGAMENFMNLTYAKWLKLPFKHLTQE